MSYGTPTIIKSRFFIMETDVGRVVIEPKDMELDLLLHEINFSETAGGYNIKNDYPDHKATKAYSAEIAHCWAAMIIYHDLSKSTLTVHVTEKEARESLETQYNICTYCGINIVSESACPNCKKSYASKK